MQKYFLCVNATFIIDKNIPMPGYLQQIPERKLIFNIHKTSQFIAHHKHIFLIFLLFYQMLIFILLFADHSLAEAFQQFVLTLAPVRCQLWKQPKALIIQL